jgi:anti-anti-sigma factor
MNPEFKKTSAPSGVTILAIKGSIHCGPECARLEEAVDAMIAAHETRVIFDMAGVTHADSAAMGSIVRCLAKLKKAGGNLHIAAAQSMIDYSLKLTRIDKLIEMFPTVTEAAASFSSTDSSAPLPSN